MDEEKTAREKREERRNDSEMERGKMQQEDENLSREK